MPTFFINGTSLSDSTAVFLDSEQLTCAPDGYYSDGTIIRQQVGCTLLPQIACPSCIPNCGDIASEDSGVGVYQLSINVGSGTGAVIINFNPYNSIEGIIAAYNGNKYNQLSSSTYGYLAGTVNLPTYIGDTTSQSSCTGASIIGGPYTLNKFQWNGTLFAPTAGTEIVNVLSGQASLSPSDPNNCVMVVPKTSSAITTVDVTIYGVCTNANFDVNVQCVAPLPTFKASNKVNSIGLGYCDLSPTIKTYYVAKVNNSPAYPYLAVHDWVFQDQYGQTKCLDGFYRTNNVIGGDDTIQVANGVIVNITTECP